MARSTSTTQQDAEALLLGESWSSVEKLPMRRLSQLSELLGITKKRTKSLQLKVMKEWRKLKLLKKEQQLGDDVRIEEERGRSIVSSASSSGPAGREDLAAARAGKRRRSLEDGDSSEDEDEGEDGQGSLSLFDDYDHGFGVGEQRLLLELDRLERERKAAKWFPDRSLGSTRCQHEYDFIKKAGRVAHAADRDSHEDIVKALNTVLSALEERALVVVVGDEEGWDTASCIVEEEVSFLTKRKGQVKEARKKAECVRRLKGKSKVFRNGRRKGRAGQARGAWPVKSASAASTSLPPAATPGETTERLSTRLACFVCGGPHLAKACPKKFGSSK